MNVQVAVIDYGMGNIRSVSKALQQAGGDRVEVVVTADPAQLRRASHVVLPGVGALRDCMNELERLQLVEVIGECFAAKPFLGICLGMQALLARSEENDGTPGLGLLGGEVLHFRGRVADPALKIPHMGWNSVQQTRPHPLWQGIADGSRFYFVHSYFVRPQQDALIAGCTDYGGRFASVIARDNVFAMQFHPEKSQHSGLQLLGNFLRWDGRCQEGHD
ncbi:MAG: imidazole glycerol phosphate synthase subunit HisH [Gammaproteobacteria bacterium]|nr:imidazole glycerol phosphate synthase subunit HisH [Gammaproteobacteria bacterium]